jgi:hypothetical protein
MYIVLCKYIYKWYLFYFFKCKKFRCVNINDLHLHDICMPYIQLLTLTCIISVVNTSECLPHNSSPQLVVGHKCNEFYFILYTPSIHPSIHHAWCASGCICLLSPPLKGITYIIVGILHYVFYFFFFHLIHESFATLEACLDLGDERWHTTKGLSQSLKVEFSI